MATSDEQAEPTEERRDTKPPERNGSTAGSFLLAALLGGFLAGGIGYLAGYFTEFGIFGSNEPDLSQTVEQQLARLDAVESRLEESGGTSAVAQEELNSVQDRLADIVGRLDAVESQAPGSAAPDSEVTAQVSQLSQTVQDIEARITELPTDTAAASRVSQLSQTVEDLQAQTSQASQGAESRASELQDRIASLEQRLSEQDQAIQSAQSEARQVSARAALAEIRAAVADGAGYTEALETLQANIDGQVPEALAGPAGGGVATLPSLQDSFASSARDALSASISETTDGPVDRTLAFLRSQTGARSLSEREGSGPDAILSRAEARMNDGDLQAALSELEGLPQSGRDAISGWLDQARTRAQATTALDDLTQTMNDN